MNRVRKALGILAVALLALASAQTRAFEGPSAERLIAECQAKSIYCEAFMNASIEAHLFLNLYVATVAGHRLVCLPESITYAGARERLMAYAARRPGDRIYSAGTFVSSVFEDAFPCHR